MVTCVQLLNEADLQALQLSREKNGALLALHSPINSGQIKQDCFNCFKGA